MKTWQKVLIWIVLILIVLWAAGAFKPLAAKWKARKGSADTPSNLAAD